MDDELFARALGEFGRRFHRVVPDQLRRPTPCTEWDVYALANHVLNELRWLPPLLDGMTIAEVGDRFDGDLLGDDPAAAFRDAAELATDAMARDGVRERTVHLSYGDAPGAEYLDQITTDLTIHAWDLARGAGFDDRLDPGLVEAVHAYLAPRVEEWRRAGAFGPAVEVGPDASPQDRLIALTGRNPRT